MQGFKKSIEKNNIDEDKSNLDIKENLARSLAVRSRLKEGSKLALDEMNSMIDQLFSCETPEYSPSGKKTMSILNGDNLSSIIG